MRFLSSLFAPRGFSSETLFFSLTDSPSLISRSFYFFPRFFLTQEFFVLLMSSHSKTVFRSSYAISLLRRFPFRSCFSFRNNGIGHNFQSALRAFGPPKTPSLQADAFPLSHKKPSRSCAETRRPKSLLDSSPGVFVKVPALSTFSPLLSFSEIQ